MWLEDVSLRIEQKLEKTSRRIADTMPHLSIKGKYDNWGENNICWWTNGFWAGINWLMYRRTGDEYYKDNARAIENKLDEAFIKFDGLHHDVGFMWSLSAVADYKLTADDHARRRGMLASSLLMARFNVEGSYIRAWNRDGNRNKDAIGYSIIDTMMNLPLLYWASLQTGDDRFKAVAMRHADKVAETFVRTDGSVNHIIVFNPKTGEIEETLGGQGYENGSAWSRGQAWALYGFALSYSYTKKTLYLDTAKRVADFFIDNLSDDFIPNCDFRQPNMPQKKDSSAGAIAASGLLLLEEITGDERYRDVALKILMSLDKNCGAWDEDEEAILKNGMIAYHEQKHGQVPIIYGDYFFIEAIEKLQGKTELFW